jgi:ABC-type nickel/cobalt efflux system permease component RcnA
MTPESEYLGQLLRQGDLTFAVVLLGTAVAFVLGAMHALSPGHGKTIVAAYLVGTRGTLRHAFLLGGIVTITHTASVFALGLTTLFLSQYVLPQKIYPVLGAISGISIVWIGAGLFLHRLRHLKGWHHDHGHSHSHVPEEVTMGSLIALAVSGGLVPCPSALVLLLTSIALGRVGFGLLLLVGFSVGLALVLIAIGAAVLYAKHLFPASRKISESRIVRWVPVLSAAVIVCVGLLMTGLSLGWIRVAPAL